MRLKSSEGWQRFTIFHGILTTSQRAMPMLEAVEASMKRSLAVLILAAAFSSACAPMFMPPPHSSYTPTWARAVGRWDAVMTLDPAALIGVITADGVAHTGRFVGAGLHWLRMHERGVEVQIARDEIARVDLLRGVRGVNGRDLARGACAGALSLGLTEMLLGAAFGGKFWMPPARTWVVGAAGGAAMGALDGLVGSRERTIYIAP